MPPHPKCAKAPGRAVGTAGMSPLCPRQRCFSWRRFVPSFLRLGSWNVVMFISYEQLQRAAALAWPAQS